MVPCPWFRLCFQYHWTNCRTVAIALIERNLCAGVSRAFLKAALAKILAQSETGQAPSLQEFFPQLRSGVDGCCDCTFRSRPYQRCVLCEDTSFVTGGRGFPFRHAACDFGVGYFKFQPSDLGVDGDLVAFADRGYRAAQRRFWSYVANHQAAGCAAEASVGDQGHTLTEAFAYDCGGDTQHFAH